MREISIDNGNAFINPLKAIEKAGFEEIVTWMDDEVREQVHSKLAPCSQLEFLNEYLRLAKNDLVIG